MKTKQNYVRRILLSVVLMLCLTFIPNIHVNAEGTAVDLIGDSTAVSVGGVKYGVSCHQTGYLCYLLTADGNAVAGTRAYAFKCPSFHTITAGGEPVFRATSRKGGYSVSGWSGTAPWNCSPFNSDRTTNAEVIRAWMKAPFSADIPNGQQLVKDLWGDACRDKFKTGEYILVIETIMHFRYSFDYTYKDLTIREWENLVHERSPGMPSSTVTMVAETYKRFADMGTEYRAPFGRPIIGTVRDCIAYQSTVYELAQSSNSFIDVENTNLFSRYLNQVAPFSERIGAGSAGERAGFIAWTGGVDTRLSNSQVNQYGVAMLVISALDDDMALGGLSPEETLAPPSDYDGTLYTLTSAGGSSSSGGGIGSFSGGGSGDTTYLGSGYGADRCAIGDLYAENCATGDEPYALADRLKSGMSYEGSVPPVIDGFNRHLFLCSKIVG